ncbi:MAG TPA: hypothetical protein VH079_14955 [Terriglobales bacterium]|jgi:hypothetical protein|nr:hypothetical protein [Terriglobales bacterium]
MGFSVRKLSQFIGFIVLGTSVSSFAQEGTLDPAPPKDIPPQQIIQRFTAKEKEWKQVREQYSFQQSLEVQEMAGLEVRSDYRQVAEISYGQGKRTKKVVFAPQASMNVSKEDLEDLETRASFTISTDELPQYTVTYVGSQKVDELHCYVFDVAPKQIEKDHRYFQGRIWVDDQDFQIVKNRGKSVPDFTVGKGKKAKENLFPQFTTWRQPIDGKYWFPTYSSADDTLHFRKSDLHIKEKLKFTDYKKTETAVPADGKAAHQ